MQHGWCRCGHCSRALCEGTRQSSNAPIKGFSLQTDTKQCTCGNGHMAQLGAYDARIPLLPFAPDDIASLHEVCSSFSLTSFLTPWVIYVRVSTISAVDDIVEIHIYPLRITLDAERGFFLTNEWAFSFLSFLAQFGRTI